MSYITSIGTATPPHCISQSTIAEFMIRAMKLNEEDARKMRALYRATGIDTRHSVIADYGRIKDFDFYSNNTDLEPFPSTKKRLNLYREHSLKISLDAIANCFRNRKDVGAKTITHLIVVSCTGMYAPGLDIDIVKALGLSSNIQRLCINFMGCYAAFNALRLADVFCKTQEDARVLVVCTELCSLHFQRENNVDNMLANAIFADGSASILLESQPRTGWNLVPESFYCDIALQGENEMAWTIGDLGFEMKLSSYVPEVIRNGIRELTESLLSRVSRNLGDVHYFALHPGGRKILEEIEGELGITKEQNKYAYEVLRKNGNMSSPTVIFVLNELCGNLNGVDGGKRVLSFAFGPGLTLESMVLKIENH